MPSELYYDPQKLGFKLLAEIDYSDGNYCFDLLCVWQDLKTGELKWARDSGCSCPSPFDETDIKDLNTLTYGSWITLVRDVKQNAHHASMSDKDSFFKKMDPYVLEMQMR